MVDRLADFERWARLARTDATPCVDVASRVLARIQREDALADRALLTFAFASVTAAILALLASYSTLQAMLDPFELWLRAPVV